MFYAFLETDYVQNSAKTNERKSGRTLTKLTEELKSFLYDFNNKSTYDRKFFKEKFCAKTSLIFSLFRKLSGFPREEFAKYFG